MGTFLRPRCRIRVKRGSDEWLAFYLPTEDKGDGRGRQRCSGGIGFFLCYRMQHEPTKVRMDLQSQAKDRVNSLALFVSKRWESA